MALFTGDSQTPDDVVYFPDNFNSFPSRIQKLLPVNYGGPNSTEFTNHGRGLDGNFLNSDRESGFLAQLSIQDAHALDHANTFVEQNGGCGGAANANGSLTVEQIRTDINADYRNIISQTRFFEADLSSSSDDDYQPSEGSKKPTRWEKKHMKLKRLELFLENITSQVTQKQEQMHNQLMEMVQKREQERIIQDEAWKQQETERAKRDEEERAQETFRSMALISFIQNLLVHENEISNLSESSYPGKDGCEIHKQDDLKDDPRNRRWPRTEVQALITVRMALDHKFLIPGSKGFAWEEIASGLAGMGFDRTPKKCREKWENINKYYRKTMENGKKRPRSFPYFDELDILYRRGIIGQGI